MFIAHFAVGLAAKRAPESRSLMAQRATTAKIDLTELEKLSSLQCTDEEIAAWFGVATRTIERRRTVKKFADVIERRKAKGRISVRRMQMKLLEQGNATMGVWLGKQILGQTDQVSHQVNGTQLLFAMPRAALPEMAPEFEPERKLLRAAENIDTSDN
jgi:hypothetical protein